MKLALTLVSNSTPSAAAGQLASTSARETRPDDPNGAARRNCCHVFAIGATALPPARPGARAWAAARPLAPSRIDLWRLGARAARVPWRRAGAGGPDAGTRSADLLGPDRRASGEGQRAALRAAGRVHGAAARTAAQVLGLPLGRGHQRPRRGGGVDARAVLRARPGCRRDADPRPRLWLGLTVDVAGRLSGRARHGRVQLARPAELDRVRARPPRPGEPRDHHRRRQRVPARREL
jgi:hypothetical protein